MTEPRPGSVEHAIAKMEARRQAKMAVRRSAYGPVQLAEYLGAPYVHVDRARSWQLIPEPDRGGRRWSAALAEEIRARWPETAAAVECVGAVGLKERGWTEAMIRDLLGKPDALRDNPYYKSADPMRLWRLQRVEAIEATPGFAQRQARATGQRAAAAKAVQTKKLWKLLGGLRSRSDGARPQPGGNQAGGEHAGAAGIPVIAVASGKSDTRGVLTVLPIVLGLILVVLAVSSIPWLMSRHDTRGSQPVHRTAPMPTGPLESERSPIERQFWAAYTLLKPPELAGLVSEHWVLGRRFRIDFALPERMIGIELDGHATHSSPQKIADDRRRQRALESAGWRIIRFGGAEIYADANSCVRQAAALAGMPPAS